MTDASKLVNIFVSPALAGAEHSNDVDLYIQLLEEAIDNETPPYFTAAYGESFRYHVDNPIWVIQSLISNAIKEGEGSRDLAKVADSCDSVGLTSDLSQHIGDEAKHCRMYVSLINTVFPDAMPSDLHDEIAATFPPIRYKSDPKEAIGLWKIFDYLIQINLGELRTRIHQKLMEPVLDAYCPMKNKEKLCSTLCALSEDECCHIQYTAARIGSLAREFKLSEVRDLFCRRVADFTRYTERELGRQKEGMLSAPLIRDK